MKNFKCSETCAARRAYRIHRRNGLT